MARRLYRSATDAMLGGVCGGLGAYFDIDSNLVRVLFIVFTALSGGFGGVLAYLALWLFVSEEGEDDRRTVADRVRDRAEEIAERARGIGDDVRRGSRTVNRGAALVLGAVLIVLGVAFLLRNLGVSWMRWVAFGSLWPILPILVGVAFLWRWVRGGK